jgi:ABC-type multidrug transport system fused ATPase/permease subunit
MLPLTKYLRPYTRETLYCILFNVLTVVFSTVSITMLLPFFNILFDQQKPVDTPPAPFSFSMHSVLEQMNWQFSELIRTSGKESALVAVCIFIIITIFLKNAFKYLALASISPVRMGIERDIRMEVFDKMLRLPLAYFSEQRKGDLISRMTADVQEVQWSILQMIEVIFREPLMMGITMFTLLYISPTLTLFVLVLLGFAGLVIGNVGRSLRKESGNIQSLLGQIISVMDETLGGLRIIKGFNADAYQKDKFKTDNDLYRRNMVRILRRKDAASPLSEFLGVSVFVALLWFGSRLVFNGEMLAGTFIVYLGLFYQIIDPAKTFSSAAFNIRKGLAAKERIDEILTAEETISDPETPEPFGVFTKKIEFRNVSFSYNDERAILKNINITIEKGKTVALVGASGAGKSTIADLIPRFYDVNEGSILIDDTDIRAMRLFDLRAKMGIVSQEAVLFNDTIYNNIVFGLPNVTPTDVENAARIANAHDFIIATENGYDTKVGDRGTKLSGGQRQRITIARAVLKNPDILILDEATSALDSESEKLVQAALLHLLQNRTSIVIAHRLSTIQHADEIIVLNEGEIIERGSHAELLSKNGSYKRLVELQGM